MANVPLLPLIVAELHASKPDINYQLYGAAYGLEMQIDNEGIQAVFVLLDGVPSRFSAALHQMDMREAADFEGFMKSPHATNPKSDEKPDSREGGFDWGSLS